MSEEETSLVPHIVVREERATPITHVSVRAPAISPLPPQEIERICKAFIRLIHAPRRKGQEKRSNDR